MGGSREQSRHTFLCGVCNGGIGRIPWLLLNPTKKWQQLSFLLTILADSGTKLLVFSSLIDLGWFQIDLLIENLEIACFWKCSGGVLGMF